MLVAGNAGDEVSLVVQESYATFGYVSACDCLRLAVGIQGESSLSTWPGLRGLPCRLFRRSILLTLVE
jgi:hypothetical protein